MSPKLTRDEMAASLRRTNDLMDGASFAFWLDVSLQEQEGEEAGLLGEYPGAADDDAYEAERLSSLRGEEVP